MRESRVEDHLIARVEATGGFTRKVQWIGRRGAPDRLCGWPKSQAELLVQVMHGSGSHGQFSLVELKRPLTPKAEAHQKREHEKLRSIGIRVDVLTSIEDVDRYVEEMTT